MLPAAGRGTSKTTAVGNTSSSKEVTTAAANGLALVPDGAGIDAGGSVDVLLLA